MEGNQESGPSGRKGRGVSRTVPTSAWYYTGKESSDHYKSLCLQEPGVKWGVCTEKPTGIVRTQFSKSEPQEFLGNLHDCTSRAHKLQ